MPEFQEKSQILLKETFTDDIFRLTLQAPAIAGAAHPGQFVMLQVDDGLDPLLRRPFSIHQVAADGIIQIVFKIVGKGTEKLSRLVTGDTVDCIGPLGRGFPLDRVDRLCLVGGGIGIAPLYFLAKRLLQAGVQTKNDYVLLGAATRNELTLFADEFFDLGYTVMTATDDGSLGHHGFITDLLEPILTHIERVYTCGPFPMMGIVAARAQAAGVQCMVSTETHMACGLGACLGCTLAGADGHYIHVCRQGPVFDSKEVAWT